MILTIRSNRMLFLSATAFLFLQSLHSEPLPDSSTATTAALQPSLSLELPVLDIPFNTKHGFSFASMHQSIAITGSVTQGVHRMLLHLWQPQVTDRSVKGILANRKLAGLCSSIFIFDVVSPFSGWTHEEGHRAVLSSRGISSYNDIYKDTFASMVSVSHVRDEDLAWLKDRHPADMVRLAEAGGEVQLEMVFQTRKGNFFCERSSWYDLVHWWINVGGLAYYILLCGDDEANSIIREETLKEDADISKRDIVGGDYLSWVYDLFRPDEPYLSGLRGRPHPSGVGVDRYIQPSELTGKELRYLRLQGGLIFLNLLSPQMFGFHRFRGTNPITHEPCWWNAAVTHHLTSFGTATGLHLFYQQGRTNLVLTYNSYLSRYKYWPGIAVELVRYPVTIAGKTLALNTSASVWLQPHGQRFSSNTSQAGCSFLVCASYPLSRYLAYYIECDVKSRGWVAGNVYLDAAAQARTGVMFSPW